MGPKHLELLPALLGSYLDIDQCVKQLRGNEHIPEAAVADAFESNSSNFALQSSHYNPGAIQAVVVLMDLRQLMCARKMNSWVLSNIKMQRTGPSMLDGPTRSLPATDLER